MQKLLNYVRARKSALLIAGVLATSTMLGACSTAGERPTKADSTSAAETSTSQSNETTPTEDATPPVDSSGSSAAIYRRIKNRLYAVPAFADCDWVTESLATGSSGGKLGICDATAATVLVLDDEMTLEAAIDAAFSDSDPLSKGLDGGTYFKTGRYYFVTPQHADAQAAHDALGATTPLKMFTLEN